MREKVFIEYTPGLEAVGETLEQLWISYNKIDKLAPLAKMEKLHTLYMAHNLVKWVPLQSHPPPLLSKQPSRDWDQFDFMRELSCLEELVFVGNPLEEESSEDGNYNKKVIHYLLALKKLDGYPVIRESNEEEEDKGEESSDSSDLDEELYNDPATQEIIKTLVL